MTLETVIGDWIRANQAAGRYQDWLYDEGMIWKPFHRFWFGVNELTVESHDKGIMYYITGKDDNLTVVLHAADPQFLDKLGQLLKDYA